MQFNELQTCTPHQCQCGAQVDKFGAMHTNSLNCIMLVETTHLTQVMNSLLYFACRRKDVHLCFIMSPGKMIFAVLEL